MNKEIKRYLGIDWGTKRIGLALGDSETKIATPFKVVGDIDEVLSVIKEEEADEIIIGEPLSMKNNKGEMSDKVVNFIEELKKEIDIPIVKIDERLSSKGADVLVGDKKNNPPSPRLRRAGAPRDAMAAMIILQTYLDKA